MVEIKETSPIGKLILILKFIVIFLNRLISGLVESLYLLFILAVIIVPLIIFLNIVSSNSNFIISSVDNVLSFSTTVYNTSASVLNSLSFIMPIFFTVWNTILRILILILDEIGKLICIPYPTNNFIIDCNIIENFDTIVERIQNFFQTTLDNILNTFEVVLGITEPLLCSAEISSVLNYTRPNACTNQTESIGGNDVIEWVVNFSEFISKRLMPLILKSITKGVELYTGEAGLKAIISGTAPHFTSKDYDEVTSITEIFVRMYEIPDILYNIIVGFTMNTIISLIDLPLCSLAPNNIVRCIISPICRGLLRDFRYPVPLFDITLNLQLGSLCDPLPYGCPCNRCPHPLGLFVPCMLNSDCLSCERANTIFDELRGGWNVIFPTLKNYENQRNLS